MGRAPQDTKVSGIPVKRAGIKPGVKPPLLFRLDATEHLENCQIAEHSLFAAALQPQQSFSVALGERGCSSRKTQTPFPNSPASTCLRRKV